MNNVFVIYDRSSNSVWYPLSDNAFDAVSGPAKGTKLPFIAKPEVMRLREWAAKYPHTLVLLPSSRLQGRLEEITNRLTGTWAMESDTGQQVIESTMTILFDGQGFDAAWESQGQEVDILELYFDGRELKFKRQIPSGQWIDFAGTVGEDGTIDGIWSMDGREIPCKGTKVKTQADTIPRDTAALIERVVGTWSMQTDFKGQMIDATLVLEYKDKKFSGLWLSMQRELELYDVAYDGTTLHFKLSMGGRGEMVFEGTIKSDAIKGVFHSEFGVLDSTGTRENDP